MLERPNSQTNAQLAYRLREWIQHSLGTKGWPKRSMDDDLLAAAEALERPGGPADGVSELARHWANVDLENASARGWPTDCIHLAREVLRLAGESSATDEIAKERSTTAELQQSRLEK